MKNIDLEQLDNEQLMELLEAFKGMQDELNTATNETKEGENNEK